MNLIEQFSWTQILPQLGIAVSPAVLPGTVQCPNCSTLTMVVSSDHAAGQQHGNRSIESLQTSSAGEWLYCRGCRFAGDLVELAERVWQVNTREVVTRLIAVGAAPAAASQQIVGYEEQRNRRARLSSLWETARTELASDQVSELCSLKARLDWHTRSSAEERYAGLGRFVGGTHRTNVEKAISATRRLFHGKGWSQLLLVPFYDLPYRLCGFLCIGQTDGDNGRLFWSLSEDAGLAFQSNLFEVTESDEMWKGRVFAIDDIDLVLRLQSRHLKEYSQPLPIISWYDGQRAGSAKPTKTAASWNAVEGRPCVFWSESPSPAFYQHAARVNGLVGHAGPVRTTWKEYLRYAAPRDFLREVSHSARPWYTDLTERLRQLGPPDLASWCTRLDWSEDEWERFLEQSSPDVRARVRELQKVVKKSRSTALYRQTIIETDAGWQLVTRLGSELLSDTVVRVDEVIYQPRTDKTYYRGRLVRGTDEVPFLDELSKIEANPLAWLRRTMLRAGQDMPFVQVGWENRLLSIASRFYAPKTSVGPGRIGWDANISAIVLPAYSIDQSGWHKHALAGDDVEALLPAKTLSEPLPVSCLDLQRLSIGTAGMRAMWATAACVVANIVAPAYGYRPCGIALEGRIPHAATAAAKAVGCSSVRVDPRDARRLIRLLGVDYDHGWPLAVEPAERPVTHINQWLDSANNCLIWVAEHTSPTLWARGGWHVLKTTTEAVLSPTEAAAASRIVPAYLLDLCERRLGLAAPVEGPYLLRVLEDIRKFLLRNGAAENIFTGVAELLRPDTPNPDVLAAFGEVLCWLAQHGNIRQTRDGFANERETPELVYSDEHVYLAYGCVNRALGKYGAPAWDIVQITEAAERAGMLHGTGSYNGCEGWFLRTEWWREQLTKWKSQHIGIVRVVG